MPLEITRKGVLGKLTELKTAYTGVGSVTELFLPATEATEAYFIQGSAELAHAIQYTIHQLILDLVNRKTVYENQSRLPAFSTDYPVGYDDVRKVFTAGGTFMEIFGMDAATFDAGYTYASASAKKTEPPTGNSYLMKWQTAISAARKQELAALSAIATFCEGGGYNAGLAMYFEQLGKVLSSPSTDEIAARIYDTGGYKEIIERFGLDIHIPSSLAN